VSHFSMLCQIFITSFFTDLKDTPSVHQRGGRQETIDHLARILHHTLTNRKRVKVGRPLETSVRFDPKVKVDAYGRNNEMDIEEMTR